MYVCTQYNILYKQCMAVNRECIKNRIVDGHSSSTKIKYWNKWLKQYDTVL